MEVGFTAAARSMLLAVVAVLAACGGNGGGDPVPSPSPAPVASPAPATTLAVDREAATLTRRSVAPADGQIVGITVNGPAIATLAVANASNASASPWLAYSVTGDGSTWTLALRLADAAVPAGIASTTLRIDALRADRTIAASHDIVVSYQLGSILTVGTTQLSFAYSPASGPTPTQTLAVVAPALAWTAEASAPWIGLNGAGQTGSGAVGVVVFGAGLDAGRHAGTITVRTNDGQVATTTVAVDVAAPSLRTSAASFTFGGVNGTAFAPQALTVDVDGSPSGTFVVAAGAPWITVDRTSAPLGSSVSIGIHPENGNLASGTYTAAVTVQTNINGTAASASIPVSLTLVRPTLVVTPSSLVLGGPLGRDSQTQSVTLSVNTGSAAFPLLASGPFFATTRPAAGSVSSVPAAVTVSGNSVVPGSQLGYLLLQVTVNGDRLMAQVPVTSNLDRHRLIADETAVAFAKTPSWSRLNRVVPVKNNFGGPTGWTASSNRPWLTTTPSGVAGQSVTLTADPTGLPIDQFQVATVTIAPGDPTVAPEQISVGIWVGSANGTRASIDGTIVQVTADPVRPLVYVHDGGASITAYNAYTAAEVFRSGPIAAQLGEMDVSSDGNRLYALDLSA